MSRVSPPHPLPALLAALTALGSLLALAAAGGAAGPWPPAALWHLVFATGALPMIFAAMIYFVPVLTRTPEPPRDLVAWPAAALTAGSLIVGWFVQGGTALRHMGPWMGLLALAGLAGWIHRRRRQCLGPPHPCLNWYAAALGCLSLGLAAVALSAVWPAQAHRLRLFHLHANTLGFMGLTAIGTLQVLLPTVLGRPDPTAAARLLRDLPWSLAGALGIAAGAAWWWPLTIPAGAAYAWPLLRLARDLWRNFGAAVVSPDQPAPLLLAATAGLSILLVHGVAHGAGCAAGRDALPAFLVGFLLPLVSGALTQLLPVWLRPGAHGEWQAVQRRRLAAFARSRVALLFAGGTLAGAGQAVGYLFGAICALWLLVAMAITVLNSRR